MALSNNNLAILAPLRLGVNKFRVIQRPDLLQTRHVTLTQETTSCKINFKRGFTAQARVVELADTPDLGSGAPRLKGSSPFSRKVTKN